MLNHYWPITSRIGVGSRPLALIAAQSSPTSSALSPICAPRRPPTPDALGDVLGQRHVSRLRPLSCRDLELRRPQPQRGGPSE
jgi:hypothetical protein